jgi:hypothetical protein
MLDWLYMAGERDELRVGRDSDRMEAKNWRRTCWLCDINSTCMRTSRGGGREGEARHGLTRHGGGKRGRDEAWVVLAVKGLPVSWT